MAAERVEQVALPAFVEEPLLVVLAVDLDERSRDLAEPGGGDRLVVQPGRRAARGGRPRGPRSAAPGAGRTARSTRAASAPCRTRVVSARAPVASPSASISRLFPAPVSPVKHVQAGRQLEPEPLDQGEVGDGQLEQAAGSPLVAGRSARRLVAGLPPTCSRHASAPHDGSSSTFWRNRSQNGWLPARLDEPDRPGERPDLDDVADRDREVLAAVDRDDRLGRVDDPARGRSGPARRRPSGSPRGSPRSGSRSGSGCPARRSGRRR